MLERHAADAHVRPTPDTRYRFVGHAPADFHATGRPRPVVVGFGPCGIFAALILAQILAGLRNARDVDVIEDRRAAIFHAVGQADAADVLLIAGKGHEDQQEVDGVKRPFLDRAVAAEALSARAAT